MSEQIAALHERIAELLTDQRVTWTVEDCQRFSLQALRSLAVGERGKPKLRAEVLSEIDAVISSGAYIYGARPS